LTIGDESSRPAQISPKETNTGLNHPEEEEGVVATILHALVLSTISYREILMGSGPWTCMCSHSFAS